MTRRLSIRCCFIALAVTAAACSSDGFDAGLEGEPVDAPETALLVDLLVPPDAPEVAEALQRAVLALARRDGAPGIATLQVEWTPWFRRFQEWGWSVWPSEWIMVASLFHPRLDPVWMRHHWWYQMGDLDVV